MKARIRKAIVKKLKQIKPDAKIYEDSVMQSTESFYFVLSIDDSGTDNVGINVQNKAWLVDIALVDNPPNRSLVDDVLSDCSAHFNQITIDGQEMFPENYVTNETDGVWHVQMTIAFPQYIEWSEE